MTVAIATRPSVYATARRIARDAGISRPRRRNQVPRLRVSSRVAPAPTLWFVCPDWDRPAGGIRKQYRAVDVLNEAGLDAAIVHKRPGFRCSWFRNRTRVAAAGDIAVADGDVIAVPEIYGPTIRDLPAGVRQVIFNQGAYLTIDTLVADGAAAAAPYVDNPDLAVVVAVSDDSARVLSYAFPGIPVRRIHHGIDPAIHHPHVERRNKRIAYMTRRRADEAAQVLSLLQRRGVLDGWEVVAIQGRTEAQVAEILRSSRIFLSFSKQEGFGLPPLEALACGCVVVGFDGFGGREFFCAPSAAPVEDGDVVGFARAVEDVIRRVDDDPRAVDAAAEAGARFVAERYSREVESRDLIDVFAPLLQA